MLARIGDGRAGTRPSSRCCRGSNSGSPRSLAESSGAAADSLLYFDAEGGDDEEEEVEEEEEKDGFTSRRVMSVNKLIGSNTGSVIGGILRFVFGFFWCV